MTTSVAPSVIILAAGQSTRMGPRNKLLLRIGETTIIERVVQKAVAAETGDVIVVLGSDREQVAAVLDSHPAKIVYNADYAEGMASSIRSGVEAAGPDRAGYAVFLGDLPEVRVSTIRNLGRTLMQNPHAIVLPNYNGLDGHPVFFGGQFYDALLRIEGDAGGRRIIEQHPDAVIRVPVVDPGISRDIDTEADWDRLNA